MRIMTFNIRAEKGLLRRHDSIPANLKKFLIPGAFQVFVTDGPNEMLFQKTNGQGFIIYALDFIIKNETIIAIESMHPFTGLYFILRGNFASDMDATGTLDFQSHQYGLLTLPSLICKTTLQGNQQYSLMTVHFTNRHLSRYAQYFTFLGQLIQKAFNKEFFHHQAPFKRINNDLTDVINRLKDSNFPIIINSLYRELKITELLLLSLVLMEDRRGTDHNLDTYEAGRIRFIMEMIIANPGNDYSFNELVRKSGLNADKLRQGFKQLYGDTIFGMLVKQRMKMAKLLLHDKSKSITDIATIAGYADAASFIHAFKKYVGMSPGLFRKNNPS